MNRSSSTHPTPPHSSSSTPWSRSFYTPPRAFAAAVVKTPVPTSALLDILSYNRAGRSPGEQHIIDKYVASLPGVVADDYGNYWLEVRKPDGERAASLFTAHTDTVHTAADDKLFKLSIREGILRRKNGGVLGADDGTGMWLLLNMIEQEVPGIYAFFRDEESGGRGSGYAATHQIVDLSHIKRCVSFDRKGTSHIITHQSRGRCCSDAFANALAAQLNDTGFGFSFSGNDGGTFTDSANYMDSIPECTNLSVGYYDQHFSTECQDLTFASRLALALARIDWEALPAERDPSARDKDEDPWWESYRRYSYHTRYLDDVPFDEESEEDRLVRLIERYPDEVAQLMIDMGWKADELQDQIAELLA